MRTLLWRECKLNSKIEHFWDDVIKDVIKVQESGIETCEFWEIEPNVLVDWWCESTTRVEIYSEYRNVVRRVNVPNSTFCAAKPCGLDITDVIVSGTETPGANATAEVITPGFLSGTYGPGFVEYSLNNFVDVQLSPVFNNLGIGRYTAYARVIGSAACVDTFDFVVQPPRTERYYIDFKTADNKHCHIGFFDRDYTGPSSELIGAGDVLTLTTLTNSTKMGGLWGTSAAITFLLDREGVMMDFYTADERKFRVDITLDDILYWRGYTIADVLDEPWLAVEGKPAVTVRATDGIGSLKLMPYAADSGIRYFARDSVFNVLKKCLQKLDLSIPVYLGINLRETTQDITGEPLQQVYVDQSAYYDEKGKADSCYEVLEKILQPFLGFVVQSKGALHVGSLPEMVTTYQRRKYDAEFILLSTDTVEDRRIIQRYAETSYREAAQRLSARPALRAAQVAVPYGPAETFVRNGDFEEWGTGGLQGWTGTAPIERALNEKGDGFRLKFTNKSNTLAGAAYIASEPYSVQGFANGVQVSFDWFLYYDPAQGQPDIFFEVICNGEYLAPPPASSEFDWWQWVAEPTTCKVEPPIDTPDGLQWVKGSFECVTFFVPKDATGPVTVKLYEPVGPNTELVLELDSLQVIEKPLRTFETMLIEGSNEIYSTAPRLELELAHGTGFGRFEALVTLAGDAPAKLFGEGYLLQEWTLRNILKQHERPTLVFNASLTGDPTPLTILQDINLPNRRFLVDGIRHRVREALSECEYYELFGGPDDLIPMNAILTEDGLPILTEDGQFMILE